MAAPPHQTINTLGGRWVLNKTLSDSIDPVLVLQGFSWMTRTMLCAAGSTLEFTVSEVEPPAGEDPSVEEGFAPARAPRADGKVTQYHFHQLITGGYKGSTETRNTDGRVREHTDWLFGTVHAQSLLLSHEEVLELEDAYLAGKEPERGPWLDESDIKGTEGKDSTNGTNSTDGTDAGKHVWSYAKSDTWAATQVWGFQLVNVDGENQRRFCRHAVVTKGSERAAIRLVYDYEEVYDAPADEADAEPEAEI